MHRIFTPELDADTRGIVEITGDEAHHAVRVKRVREGEQVELLDGAGNVGQAVVCRVDRSGRTGAVLTLEIALVRSVAPVRPRIVVRSPVPKGDAFELMIDMLSQVGAAAWGPLGTEHSERKPRRMDRARRTAIESAKQCGRAHLLELLDPVDLDDLLTDGNATVIVADAGGTDLLDAETEEAVVLIGPEGGFSPAERDRIARSNARVMCFGPHVMRIETAAVVAASGMLRARTLWKG